MTAAKFTLEITTEPQNYTSNYYYYYYYYYYFVERIDEYRMVRRVLMPEVSGGRVRGRPRLGWMDGVKVTLGNGGMTEETAQ